MGTPDYYESFVNALIRDIQRDSVPIFDAVGYATVVLKSQCNDTCCFSELLAYQRVSCESDASCGVNNAG